MKPIAISLHDAMSQGSTACAMFSISVYHSRLAAARNAGLDALSKNIKGGRPTPGQRQRQRELSAARDASTFLADHFKALASAMRKIERS